MTNNFFDFSDLEESIQYISVSKEEFESKLSCQYINFSNLIANQIVNQPKNNSEITVKNLAESLASYTD